MVADCTAMLAAVNGTAFGRAVEPEVKNTPTILSLGNNDDGGNDGIVSSDAERTLVVIGLVMSGCGGVVE